MRTKLILIVITLWSLTALSGAIAQGEEFLILNRQTEFELRDSITKKYGPILVEKVSLDKINYIYIFPNIRGGGRGVKDIVVYMGNDADGWSLILWRRTSAEKVVAKVEDKQLIFSGNNKIMLVSLPLGLTDKE